MAQAPGKDSWAGGSHRAPPPVDPGRPAAMDSGLTEEDLELLVRCCSATGCMP